MSAPVQERADPRTSPATAKARVGSSLGPLARLWPAAAGRWELGTGELAASLAGLAAIAVMVFWAAHDGGYDTDTWSWCGLVLMSLLVATGLAVSRRHRRALSRPAVAGLTLFTGYVAWSYLSITWAASPGDAFQGSNRALTYLALFALMVAIPWTARIALAAITGYALAIGTLAFVLLFRLGLNSGVANLIIGHRLAAPTGYFNATAALFTTGAILAVGLAAQRQIPPFVRGLLLAMGTAELELATAVQSRGWLFTLPLVLLLTLLVSSRRLRYTAASAIPFAATLACLHRVLLLGQAQTGGAVQHAAVTAGSACLLSCAAAFAAGVVLAWGDVLRGDRHLSGTWHRRIGAGLVVAGVAIIVAGGSIATHGHPLRFVSRQVNGFTTDPSAQTSSSLASHFSEVGSGRYDFWRVSLEAFAAHPIGGLGQDNFDSYYLQHGHTSEEPAWTHSLEMRLLAHTGIVGFLLFIGFLGCAATAGLRGRGRLDARAGAVIGLAVLPLIDWLLHGSVDWFWEMPALAGPALGFLGMAIAVSASPTSDLNRAGRPTGPRPGATSPRLRVAAWVGASVLALAGTAVLAAQYLSAREMDLAAQVRQSDPTRSLALLHTAAALNPLDAGPDRLAGAIAMQTNLPAVAQTRFRQSIDRAPQAWFAWLGAGLAASQLHEAGSARRDFAIAAELNHDQPVIRVAEARAQTAQPLTYDQMLSMLQLSD